MTSKAKLSAILSTAASYGYDVRSMSLLGAVLSDLVERLPEDEAASAAPPLTVEVTLFKASGKFYTTEPWRIPAGAIGPYDMVRSPDFRRINGDGAVLIGTQEPWGFPHLFPATCGAASGVPVPTAHQIGDDEVKAFREAYYVVRGVSPKTDAVLSGLEAVARASNYGVPTRESRREELLANGFEDHEVDSWLDVSWFEAVRQAHTNSAEIARLFEVIDKLHEQARHSVRDNLDLRQAAVHAAATAAANVGEVSYDYWHSVAEAVINAVLEVESSG